MSTDASQLRQIRARLDALDGAQWLLSTDGDVSFVETRTRHGELNEIARFHRGATPDEIEFAASAPHMVGFLLGLVDRAIASARRTNHNQQFRKKANNFAAEAAMKCEEPAFKVFLEERHGLERPLTTERVAQKLRSLLKISSRKELNTDHAAAARWREFRANFDAWRRAG